MWSVVLAHTPETYDRLIQELWSAGTTGIVERQTTVEAFFEDPDAIDGVLKHWSPLRISEAEDVDWEQYTKDSFPALEVGARFFLAPPWSEEATPEGRIRLVINPGLACGTGYHPCTRLCIEALERHVKPGWNLLDVGAGSGILSIAASHLGAHPVACDIDAEAMPYCEAAVKFIGSTSAVATESFDAIVANISAATNRELWPDYCRIVRASGIVILSGFEEFDPPTTLTSRDRKGAPAQLLLTPHIGRLELEGWQCLIFERPRGR